MVLRSMGSSKSAARGLLLLILYHPFLLSHTCLDISLFRVSARFVSHYFLQKILMWWKSWVMNNFRQQELCCANWKLFKLSIICAMSHPITNIIACGYHFFGPRKAGCLPVPFALLLPPSVYLIRLKLGVSSWGIEPRKLLQYKKQEQIEN